MIELTLHDWFFMGTFFTFWFILSFFMLMCYAIWQENSKDKYYFTVKDIFLATLFAPFTIVCGIIYLILWFIMTVLHFENLVESISDFMNKPIKFKHKENKD